MPERARYVAGAGRFAIAVGLVLFAFVLANVVVKLFMVGMWYAAVALLLAAPVFWVMNRYPFAAVMVWLALAPFVMTGEGGDDRRLYWILHRALPIAVLAVILVSRWVGARKDKLPSLGAPELMMGAYVLLTLVSIGYRSPEPGVTFFYMFDHVIIPMSLYLVVRLLQPDEDDLRRLVPVLGFFLVAQALVGTLGWVAPDVLPAGWLGRDDRATGTLRNPNVYATALLFAGLYLTHYSQTLRRGSVTRLLCVCALPLAAIMAVVTLSRAAWLAGVVVVVGLGFRFVYPHLFRRLLAIGMIAFLAMFMGGILDSARATVSERAGAEASALSRLPVYVASLRMIQAQPAFGWGYENFDRYDYQFTSAIDDVFVPDKDHSSHNLFLTLAAEGGIIGAALYLGPAIWWVVASREGSRHLPRQGLRSQKLVGILIVAMTAQVVAYSFSNNRVAFGLGLWWLIIGLLASVSDWKGRVTTQAQNALRSRVEALQAETSGISDLRRS